MEVNKWNLKTFYYKLLEVDFEKKNIMHINFASITSIQKAYSRSQNKNENSERKCP